jgi:hypothetical protein
MSFALRYIKYFIKSKVKNVRIWVVRLLFLIISISIFIFLFVNLNSENLSYSKEGAFEDEKVISESAISIKSKSEIEIENLNYSGKTKNKDFFTIFSKKALRSESGEYKLNFVDSEFIINGDKIHITSDKGFFYEKDNTMILDGNISANYKDMKFFTDKMNLSVDKKTLSSHDKVTVNGDDISIVSDSAKIINGEKLEFKGNVETHINISY